jgi:hypothetical protein
MPKYKGAKKQSSVYDSDDRSKGFTQKGVPEKNYMEAQEGLSKETEVEKMNLVLKENKG